MDPLQIISEYYSPDSEAYHILVNHSRSVADKALELAKQHPEMNLDLQFIEEAALLHDLSVFCCNAPSIDCHGDSPYICHGYQGAELLRKAGYPKHARVCERHTGTGITREMIETEQLPLPPGDYVPETLEEQLICFADKFFSKTKPGKEKSVEKVRAGLQKHGNETVERFDNWCKLFLGK